MILLNILQNVAILFKYFVSHTMIIFQNDASPLLDKELDDEGNHP